MNKRPSQLVCQSLNNTSFQDISNIMNDNSLLTGRSRSPRKINPGIERMDSNESEGCINIMSGLESGMSSKMAVRDEKFSLKSP